MPIHLVLTNTSVDQFAVDKYEYVKLRGCNVSGQEKHANERRKVCE